MAQSYVEQLKGLWGEIFCQICRPDFYIHQSTRGKNVRRRKSAGQRSTYTFGLGSLLYVAKNLQARGYVQQDNENIGSGGTWSSRKTDGGSWLERYPVRSLYVVDTVRTRGVRTMAIECLEGGGYCGGLQCRQAPVLRACGRTGDCSQATPPWCGEHHRSHSAVTGGPMTTVCPPRAPLRTILY